MESTVHQFVRVLRLRGFRVSVSESLDALRGLCVPGALAERDLFREVLRACLVKDHRDDAAFDEIFDLFFSPILPASGSGASADDDDIADGQALENFTLGEVGQRPPRADMESPDAEVGDLFDEDDLIERYSPHPELNPINMSSESEDELVLSQDDVAGLDNANRVQLETDRFDGSTPPGQLSRANSHQVDADLSSQQQEALLGWLDRRTEEIDADEDGAYDEDLRDHLAGLLANLPEALKNHIEQLLKHGGRATGEPGSAGPADQIEQAERDELEESMRRLAQSLRGGLTSRRSVSARGRVDSARTMRRNMRFDGVPFRPTTVRRTEDKPRLVVLADVSLSVRATSRFTLHLVHGLQDQFRQVRTFAFVAELAEVTSLFAAHPVEHALGLIFGGDTLDVDADSDYGRMFGDFLNEHRGALDRRTTVIVLGDGRNNGRQPNVPALEEIAGLVKELIWLTPEPRYSWGLGGCELPRYAEHCDRVQVVRDLAGLRRTAERMASEVTGR